MDDFFSTPAEEDPTASFLAREQAALGVEAAADFNASSSTPHNGSHFPDLDTHDSTPGAGPELGLGGDGFMDGFGQAPVLQQAQNGYGITTPAPYGQAPSLMSAAPLALASSTSAFTSNEPESSALQAWRVKQSEEIKAREAKSEEKKEAMIVKAQSDIDHFYQQYNANKAQAIARNKADEAEFVQLRIDALAKGTTWERICELVELKDSRSKTTSKSTKDLARFREVLLSLRKETNAPSASY